MYKPFKPNQGLKSLMLLVTMAIFSLFATPSLAQDFKITGKVLGTNSSTIPGATIKVKGKPAGTATDIDGNFTIKATKGDVLTVSYVGYKSQDVTIASSTSLTVTLEEDNQKIDEVVVVGYGTMKKSDLTGSVASVKTKELLKTATTNPAEALQGRVSGVSIQKFGGNAGAGVSMKVRGITSFGNSEPLTIIDGFPGTISSVNPADIESLEILKDGAASAIYGSVAANGVVIITTKSGKKGKIKIDVNSYISINKISNQLDLLDADGYKKVHKMMYDEYNRQYPSNQQTLPAYISAASSINTDWQDAAFKDGFTQNHSVSVVGGQDELKFALTSNFSDDNGILIGNRYTQKGTRLKVGFKKSILDVDANMWYRDTKNIQPDYSLKEVYMISPLVPVYDSKQEFGFGLSGENGLPGNRNVIADDYYRTSWKKGQNFNGNISAALNFTSWLQFKSSFSFNNTNSQYFSHNPKYVAHPKEKNEYPFYSENRNYKEEQLVDNLITFNKTIGKHSVNAILGTSLTKTKENWNTVSVEGKTGVTTVVNGGINITEKPAGFLDQYFMTLDAGKGGTYAGSGSNYVYNRFSYFGRLNYSYNSRYLLQATFRRDGSSKFGKESRWGTFPSIALGWKINEEEFFPKNDIVNNLKLRASYGRLGSESALGYYDFQSLVSSGNNLWFGSVQGDGANPWPGSIASTLENRMLKWETTVSRNIGLDFGFLNNKISGLVNYYHNNTQDLLITKVLAPSAGLDNPILNVGEFKNTGIEVELNYRSSINKFNYNIGLNLSTTRNEVVKLADKGQTIPGEGLKYGTEHFPTQTREGKPIGSFYLYKTAGLFQSMTEVNAYKNSKGELIQPNAQPGDIKFVDANGDGAITEDDRVYSGSAIPKVEANISFNASYVGFDLSFLIGSNWGRKLYNANRYFYENMSSPSNFLSSTLNSWTPQNTNTTIPRAVYNDPNGNVKLESDRFLESGDFIRLRQLQLGYTLPQSILKKVNMESVRVYVSGNNLLTWTDYTGVDPEFARSTPVNAGIDNMIYPFTKSYVFGVQFTF